MARKSVTVLQGIGKVAVATVLTGPIGGLQESANQAIDAIVAKSARANPQTVKGILARIESSLEALTAAEGLAKDTRAVVLDHTRLVLQHHGATGAELIELGLDADRVAALVVRRGARLLGGLSQGDRDLCARAVAAVYAALIDDPDALPHLERAFQRHVVERLEQVAQVPSQVGDALKDFAAAHDAVSPDREWAAIVSVYLPALEAALAKASKQFVELMAVDGAERHQRSYEGDTDERSTSALALLERDTWRRAAIVGGPGTGKTTLLARYALAECRRRADAGPVPVVVALRRYDTSLPELVRRELLRHGVTVRQESVEGLLASGRLALLLDGLNETPAARARADIAHVWNAFPRCRVVISTRELDPLLASSSDSLLHLQPWDAPRIRAFATSRLGSRRSRDFMEGAPDALRELFATPLLLSMLTEIYRRRGRHPSDLGDTLRQFTGLYELGDKAEAVIDAEVRRWWRRVLQHLAFEMTDDCGATRARLGLRREEANRSAGAFLNGRAPGAEDLALRCVEALVSHHLLRVRSDESVIEFPHQLLQEYFAAEELLRRLPSVDDTDLSVAFLNLTKWTEPFVLLMPLADAKQQQRIVAAALNVDLGLAARLASVATSLHTHRAVVEAIAAVTAPKRLAFTFPDRDPADQIWWLDKKLVHKLQLLGTTRSDLAVPHILDALVLD